MALLDLTFAFSNSSSSTTGSSVSEVVGYCCHGDHTPQSSVHVMLAHVNPSLTFSSHNGHLCQRRDIKMLLKHEPN